MAVASEGETTGNAGAAGSDDQGQAGAPDDSACRPIGPSVCDGSGTRAARADGAIEDFESPTPAFGWYGSSWFRLAGGAAGTGFAASSAHATGKDFFALVFDLRIEQSPCIDVSAFDGLSFWAKSDAHYAQLFVALMTPGNTPVGLVSQGDGVAGCPTGAAELLIFPKWQQYSLRFDGWQGLGKLLRRIVWKIPAGEGSFELDEVALFKGEPKSAPVHL